MSEYSYDQGEENWLNDLLGRGKGDPDSHTPPWEKVEHRYIGQDKPVVTHGEDPIANWTGHQANQRPSWYDSDNDARSPLEAGYEPLESDTN